MQVRAADFQFAGRSEPVPGMSAKSGQNQFPPETIDGFMERASWNFRGHCQWLEFRRQVLDAELRAVGKDQAALDYVLKLAHVAWPLVAGQRTQEPRTEATNVFLVDLCEMTAEKLSQNRDVGTAVPEGRKIDPEHGNAKIEVLTKSPLSHHGF